jgi:hypothetical protein
VLPFRSQVACKRPLRLLLLLLFFITMDCLLHVVANAQLNAKHGALIDARGEQQQT